MPDVIQVTPTMRYEKVCNYFDNIKDKLRNIIDNNDFFKRTITLLDQPKLYLSTPMDSVVDYFVIATYNATYLPEYVFYNNYQTEHAERLFRDRVFDDLTELWSVCIDSILLDNDTKIVPITDFRFSDDYDCGVLLVAFDDSDIIDVEKTSNS